MREIPIEEKKNYFNPYIRWTAGFLAILGMAPHGGVLLLQYFVGVPIWLAELTRFIPYYWLLLPALAAVIFTIVLPKLWIFLAFLNAAILVVLTMGFQWNIQDDENIAGTQLRIMTYNVKAFQALQRKDGLDEIAREIRLFQSDIVALQDADSWVASRSDNGVSDVPPMFGLPHVVAMGQYLVASRYPLSQCVPGKIDFRDQSHQYLICLVNVNGKVLNLVIAHFVSPRSALVSVSTDFWSGLKNWQINFDDRLTQSKSLQSGLAQLSLPLIVLGDFNAQEGSLVIETLKKSGLQNTFSVAGRGYGYTHGHAIDQGLDLFRIDHILVSTGIAVKKSVVGQGEASEHKPVVSDLVLLP